MPTTLLVSEILRDILDAFKVQFPLLSAISTDFSTETVKLGQQVIAKVSLLPTVRDYDATNGYKANAAESTALFADVPVTVNRHKHVPVKIDYLDRLSTDNKIDLYEAAIKNMAFALGKEACDYVMSLIVAANFSQSSTFSVANSDKDMTDDICGDMNIIGASPIGRFGIVNTGVYNTLEADARIASADYAHQSRNGNAYGRLRNISGFESIFEYPSLPGNSINLTGFFATKSAVVLASRAPTDQFDMAKRMGLPNIAKIEVLRDTDTGLALVGISWIEPGTFDVYLTIAWIYGAAAGKMAGSTGDILDYAGHRLVSA